MSKFSEYKNNIFDASYSYPCPICGGDLKRIRPQKLVLDGNSVFECSKNASHRFWKNNRENHGHLHSNKYASETLFNSDQDYIWNEKEKKWEIDK